MVKILINPYYSKDSLIANKEGYYMFHHPRLKQCTLLDVDKNGSVISWVGRPKEAKMIMKLGSLIAEKETILPKIRKTYTKKGV